MNAKLFLPKANAPLTFEVNLLDASDEQLMEVSDELGLCMSLQEMKTVQAYFKKEGRKPTDVELQTIGQTWSEHCFHKTFKGKIV